MYSSLLTFKYTVATILLIHYGLRNKRLTYWVRYKIGEFVWREVFISSQHCLTHPILSYLFGLDIYPLVWILVEDKTENLAKLWNSLTQIMKREQGRAGRWGCWIDQEVLLLSQLQRWWFSSADLEPMRAERRGLVVSVGCFGCCFWPQVSLYFLQPSCPF